MFFRQILDEQLAQYAYLIGCQRTGEAIIIDPERDIDRYLKVAAAENLKVVAATETHIHADFLSGVREFAETGVRVYLSDEGDADWKYTWHTAGSYHAKLVRHGDIINIGHIAIEVRHTPGHTPEHISFLVTDRGGGATEPMGIASGDFVFVGDLGRPDLLETAAGHVGAMEPSARTLFESAQRFLDLPDYLQVWPGHGAGSACGKALGAVPETTVGYERRFSPALAAAQTTQAEFVDFILAGQPEPPAYFARMKRLNKEGPPLLGSLPQPRKTSAEELGGDAVVLDTRTDRDAFVRGHIPGSIFAPLDKSFPTIAGCYVDPDQQVCLIVDDHDLERAVRGLVKIGIDKVVAYLPIDALDTLSTSGQLSAMDVTDFAGVEQRRNNSNVHVLDVRRSAEFALGHVPGAQNIAHTQLLPHLNDVPSDKSVFVHCAAGARALPAASLLKRAGCDVVYVNDAFANYERIGAKAVAASE